MPPQVNPLLIGPPRGGGGMGGVNPYFGTGSGGPRIIGDPTMPTRIGPNPNLVPNSRIGPNPDLFGGMGGTGGNLVGPNSNIFG